MREADRRLEAVRRQLDRETERVVEVDRVHEAPVLDAAVPDPARVEPLHRLIERRLRHRERDVVDATGIGRCPAWVGRPGLVGEDGDEAAVARIEVEVALSLVVEVGLIEHERHAQQALPEVDRRLPVGAADRDVVHALALKLLHQPLYLRRMFYELGLVVAALQASPRNQLDLGLHDEDVTQSVADRVGKTGCAGRPCASSTLTGRGGSCLTPRVRGLTRMLPLISRGERAHHLTHGRGEDVDSADDEHVVRSPDAADARGRAATLARSRSDLHVVTGAESQQRGRTLTEMRQHELAAGAVGHLTRLAGLRIDQLRVDEASCAEMHAVLLFAFTPERRTDVADPHRLGDPGPPARLELRPEGRLAAARLAGDEQTLDTRPDEIEVTLRRPFDQVRGIRRRECRSLGLELVDREHQPFGVAGADGNVTQPDAVEGGESHSGHERAGAVGGDDPLSLPDTRAGVAPRRAGHPVREIIPRQRDVARRAGRPARRVDPEDLGS